MGPWPMGPWPMGTWPMARGPMPMTHGPWAHCPLFGPWTLGPWPFISAHGPWVLYMGVSGLIIPYYSLLTPGVGVKFFSVGVVDAGKHSTTSDALRRAHGVMAVGGLQLCASWPLQHVCGLEDDWKE